MQEFVWPIRVYYEDTDSGGVVYHSQYVNFMERARTEWLRALGVEQSTLRQEQGLLFAVHSMQINYRRPAVFNDLLQVISRLQKRSGASIVFEQSIYRGEELLCDALVRVASLNAETFRPKPIPNFILTELHSDC
ncbi:MAG: tol-pal system-associated acyl-CoA thioesterase [Pseudomonadota bacterium]|jgi:acyl-CoA thioester hydrolase|uniref:Tol-pal system-associated acyl-CoA thioesterase n=1 Tax=Methylophaga thalassica TaxID=40223 RepID=A0ABQ5U0J1_9GAMM|nr:MULTISPECIES: tol-pal system-associated acyl-CoA thioesterase [Methylophaga]MEC9411462.1 tol-pal system-associated acyl-CoA thioesterase [Pseudomonadota bacterium]WVI85214.1 tol-pal system-associated acyl-CoA thioesterase [Methylophaga thalassica]GLQ00311.1 tol-pal system-associated acyl-CoA thioesterase [Methylophaga thalassica]HIC46264.1 tol-pal system-associated acyl-CoA thioesterase [Methylophaga sp.]HIM38323.1 tol-pal system-associated acyl-CoA thioesterase [Methylophaga aminisulfidivo